MAQKVNYNLTRKHGSVTRTPTQRNRFRSKSLSSPASRSTVCFPLGAERVASHIYVVQDENVVLDSALAEVFGVETGHLVVRAMKRNARA